MMRRWAPAAIATAMVFTGCGDSTGPRPFSGTYVLAEIDGEGPPLVTSDHTFNGERLVLSVLYDTIQFTSATTARRSESRQALRYDITGTPQLAQAESATYTGEVQRDGSVVLITWDRPIGPVLQELVLVDGKLKWVTTVGLLCEHGCPAPRAAVFTYARP